VTETRTATFELPLYSVDTDAALSRTDLDELSNNLESRAAFDDGSTGASLPATLLKAGRYFRQSYSDGYALHRRSASAWEWVGGTVMPVRRLYRGAAGTDIMWSTDVAGAAATATMKASGDFATNTSVRSLLASAGADLTATLDPTSTGRSYVRTRADGERGLVIAAHGSGAAALLTARESGGSDVLTVDALGRLRTSVPAAFGQASPITGVPIAIAALVGTAGSAARLYGSTAAPVTSALQLLRSLSDGSPIFDALPDHITLGRAAWSGGQLSLLAPTLDSAGTWGHTGSFSASGAVATGALAVAGTVAATGAITSYGGRVVITVDDLAQVLSPSPHELVHLSTDDMLYRWTGSAWLGVAYLTAGGHARYTNTGAGADQSIPTTTTRRIYLPTAIDTTGDVTITAGDATSGSYFTLNRGGRWALDGSGSWGGATGTTIRSVFIADDADTTVYRAANGYNKDTTLANAVAVTRRFAAGAKVALWAYHEQGGNVSIRRDSEITSFSLTWLGL
jgi:hypothetical protein